MIIDLVYARRTVVARERCVLRVERSRRCEFGLIDAIKLSTRHHEILREE